MWVGEDGDRPVVLRSGLQSKKPCRTTGGRHSGREDNNDQPQSKTRILTMFFKHAGLLIVDILAEKTTMISRQVLLRKITGEGCFCSLGATTKRLNHMQEHCYFMAMLLATPTQQLCVLVLFQDCPLYTRG